VDVVVEFAKGIRHNQAVRLHRDLVGFTVRLAELVVRGGGICKTCIPD
jgi:hypothetical protein